MSTLFLIMCDTDTTFNFILAMLQSQLINLLCDRADDVYGGRLPVHVRLILDEFANIGQIPNFALPRRSYLIAAMFGILKAGAAYLPIDLEYPQDRINYMLEDSKAAYLITKENAQG